MNTHQIPISLALTDDDIDNIMLSGLEGGGLNHWINGMVTPKGNDFKGAEWASHALSKGATLLIPDGVGDGDKTHELTLEKFLAGYRAWAEWSLKQHGKLLDVDVLDAGDADCIVQFALFGDIIYG